MAGIILITVALIADSNRPQCLMSEIIEDRS